ncbi:hypothetical protein N7578_00425 [Agrobacterium tumefaciens]|nr:hypothetical protein [Agrobacterium tumefaciens]MDS7593967.1 hypothetical protein [Agrobacterium tumefaciens]
MAPVELIGLAGRIAERHVGFGRHSPTILRPALNMEGSANSWIVSTRFNCPSIRLHPQQFDVSSALPRSEFSRGPFTKRLSVE